MLRDSKRCRLAVEIMAAFVPDFGKMLKGTTESCIAIEQKGSHSSQQSLLALAYVYCHC